MVTHCVFVHIFIVHSSVERHLDYFHLLALVNKAAMIMAEKVSVE